MQFLPSSSSNPTGINKPSSRSPFSVIYTTVSQRGVSSLYTGCSSLVVGTGVKAAVRFLAFDTIKGQLVDRNGKLTAWRGVLAGMGAGVFESVFAVTPFETLKTVLIEDGKRAQPRYRLFAVTLRQSANSAVRMGSYNWLKSLVQARQVNANANLNSTTTFGLGAISGVITVYTTMPFDTVKTRMQSISAKADYSSTLDCASKILRREGIRAFWSGSTARLSRLIFSGGIVFTVYERVTEILEPV